MDIKYCKGLKQEIKGCRAIRQKLYIAILNSHCLNDNIPGRGTKQHSKIYYVPVETEAKQIIGKPSDAYRESHLYNVLGKCRIYMMHKMSFYEPNPNQIKQIMNCTIERKPSPELIGKIIRVNSDIQARALGHDYNNNSRLF